MKCCEQKTIGLRLPRWNYCDADPIGGRAAFDDLSIVTDSIWDARLDRVMPIIEEEQPLMCRLMEEAVCVGSKVLDIGIGSGVLGVWAARKKQSRVLGVDVSKRSLRFARRNAEQNSVQVCRLEKDGREGSVALALGRVEELVHSGSIGSSSFDVVLMNPPFTPTCSVISPALHANAGEDAQLPFRTQIELVPGLLRVGGVLIGYQMSYDPIPGVVSALATITSAFRGECTIEYAHVLNDNPGYPVERFLYAQYQSILDKASRDGNSALRTGVEAYIERIGGHGECFSLVYYEARRTASRSVHVPSELNLICKPNRTWADRVWLHQQIVESSPFVAQGAEPTRRRLGGTEASLDASETLPF
jgi:hypothetical protein